MKHVRILFAVAVIALVAASPIFADKPTGFDSNGKEIAWSNSSCNKIQSGLITDSAGNPLSVGYDVYGYNYQAHHFLGTYDSVDRNLDGTYFGATGDYVDDRLEMKWSDEWLANVDCDGDGKLDRGLVNGSVTGVSLGWTTNHVQGDFTDANGVLQNYTYFVKIGYTGPGSPLWGSYTILEEIYNSPSEGYHGVLTLVDPGLGHYLVH